MDGELQNIKKSLNEEKDKNEQLKKDLSLKTKEIKDFHSKYDGALKNFELLSEENQRLKNVDEKLQKVEETKSQLETENKGLNEMINKGETKLDFLKNSAETYYDVVIDINSIYSIINEGWEIKYNKERKEIYDKIIKEETMKIGVLGLNNVGKSYLLSKMVHVEIPTGHSIETKGISIKYSEIEKGEEKGICILDSAGFETPLLIKRNTLFMAVICIPNM